MSPGIVARDRKLKAENEPRGVTSRERAEPATEVYELRLIGMPRLRFGMIPGTNPELLKIAKTGQRARSYADRDPGHLLAFEIRWSDEKFPQMLTQFESSPEFGGASGSDGCRDDEPGGDEDGDKDEEDGDNQQVSGELRENHEYPSLIIDLLRQSTLMMGICAGQKPEFKYCALNKEEILASVREGEAAGVHFPSVVGFLTGQGQTRLFRHSARVDPRGELELLRREVKRCWLDGPRLLTQALGSQCRDRRGDNRSGFLKWRVGEDDESGLRMRDCWLGMWTFQGHGANTIANCFRHCKLRSTDNMTFENSDEGGESTQELQNLIKELGYRNAMDVEDVLTHPEENVVAQLLTDEEIIESVIGINKDDIDEEDDESSTMEPPSRNEAIKAAITLNNFLLSYEKTTPEVLTMLRKIRDEIQGEIDFNKKQKTIESFFKKPS
ncbi:hypothetical protein Tco_0706539 [Tanacetum coccineum]|uniref:Uncharacterized protein n=1 Tax=Tanacetum coccineum TaxID=301880 RepID=A0ABQ4Y9T5_9ASTR